MASSVDATAVVVDGFTCSCLCQSALESHERKSEQGKVKRDVRMDVRQLRRDGKEAVAFDGGESCDGRFQQGEQV